MDFETHQNAEHWRSFSDGLSRLRQTSGTKQFYEIAFQFLNGYVDIDSCAVFKISADKTTGCEHVCTFGKLGDDLADFLAERYVSGGYLNDPIIQTSIPKVSKVRHIATQTYSEAYRSGFFEKANITDKVTALNFTSAALFSINFYRLEPSPSFVHQDLKDLERLGPILIHHILQHVLTNTADNSSRSGRIQKRIDRLMADSTLPFSVLSLREKQVCRGLLLGKTEKLLAEQLGVKISSLVTYRKRIHSKLNIENKEQLFQLALLHA